MAELEWKALAVADLMAIVDYISDDNPNAALALMEEIQSKVASFQRIRNAAAPAGWRARGSWWSDPTTSSSMRKPQRR